jgi:hypothetical protein
MYILHTIVVDQSNLIVAHQPAKHGQSWLNHAIKVLRQSVHPKTNELAEIL